MFPRAHGKSISVPVDNAALPFSLGEEITDDLIQSQAFIRNDQPYAFESTFFQVTQEVAPGFFVFTAAFKKKYLVHISHLLFIRLLNNSLLAR